MYKNFFFYKKKVFFVPEIFGHKNPSLNPDPDFAKRLDPDPDMN
jgi:hypothetical protein